MHCHDILAEHVKWAKHDITVYIIYIYDVLPVVEGVQFLSLERIPCRTTFRKGDQNYVSLLFRSCIF